MSSCVASHFNEMTTEKERNHRDSKCSIDWEVKTPLAVLSPFRQSALRMDFSLVFRCLSMSFHVFPCLSMSLLLILLLPSFQLMEHLRSCKRQGELTILVVGIHQPFVLSFLYSVHFRLTHSFETLLWVM